MSRVTGQLHHAANRRRRVVDMWWFDFAFLWQAIGASKIHAERMAALDALMERAKAIGAEVGFYVVPEASA